MGISPFALDGKTAIVTGGGTGIGKAIAIEFARAGAHVAVCSRSLEHLESWMTGATIVVDGGPAPRETYD